VSNFIATIPKFFSLNERQVVQRDEATLLDIANAARLVLVFVQGMVKEAFLAEHRLIRARWPNSRCC